MERVSILLKIFGNQCIPCILLSSCIAKSIHPHGCRKYSSLLAATASKTPQPASPKLHQTRNPHIRHANLRRYSVLKSTDTKLSEYSNCQFGVFNNVCFNCGVPSKRVHSMRNPLGTSWRKGLRPIDNVDLSRHQRGSKKVYAESTRRGIGMTKNNWRESLCISVDADDELATPQNVEDLLFEMFKDEKENKVHTGTFLAALMETGLRKNDPRLQEMNDNLLAVHAQLDNPHATSISSLKLEFNAFKKVIRDNIVLISRALRHKFVIPEWEDFCEQIEEFYEYCKSFEEGKVASYIPQLARFNPNYWGVSVCSTDGQRISIGDTNVPFTMQSCSKPLTYAIALNELCSETVHNYVGQEPSGRMFNAIVLDYNDKPHNPLVNAGSIVTNALLYTLVKPDMSSSEKFDFVQEYFRRMAGNETVGFSNGTFLSEREHADRNYALGYYMRENKCFPEKCDLMASLDLYFQCCSMEVTAESVSIMAATLANGGICPITGEKVLQPNAVRDVLSLMHSCGMYDYSGQFAFKVGLPAKSGVCGAIMLVIPNVMGVCSWSPPLDSLGNSVRGIKFCERMVEVFNFHRYDNLRHAANKKDPRRQRYESRGKKVVSLLFSAAAGDVTALRRYALSGMDMEESDYDGRTALHLASIEGHLEAVNFLLHKCKVNPGSRDRWNRTPADDAKAAGHHEIEELIQAAAKIFVREERKETTIQEINEEDEKENKEK